MQALSTYHDNELLARLSAGDEDAFAQIYHRYWELLLGMAYNRLKNLQTAEDIVHDVFASIWHNRTKQEIKSLKNYLATAVKYMILKEARKAALLRMYQQKELGNPTYITIPDNVLDHKRLLAMVQKDIASLPEKCRIIFRCSREEGMTVNQIAERMNISPKTVENQMNKALRHLKQTVKSMLYSFFTLLL